MFTFLRPPSFVPSALAGAGSSAGVATVLGVGASRHAAAGAAAGLATVLGYSTAQSAGVGLAAGTSTVLGVSPTNTSGAGTAAGTSTAAAIGSSAVASTGTVRGRARAVSMDTLLELQFEGADNSTSFVDTSPYARTLTAVGGAAIRWSQFARGGSAGLFGAGSAVTAPHDTALNFATGDFTIHLRVRQTNGLGNQVLATKAANSSTLYPFQVWYNAAATAYGFRGFSDTSSLVYNLQTAANTLNVWQDLECSRQGDTFRIYLDGVLQASTTFSGTLFSNTSAASVGGFADGSFALTGFLDDVQFVRGGAIHTADFDPEW